MTDRFDSDRMAMIAAWRLVTEGLDVPPGKCRCALCGDSPHPSAKTVRAFLPAHFPFPSLIIPGAEEVCAGCVKIFGGKPSKTTPPVRTRHVTVSERDGVRLHERTSDLWPYLAEPDGVSVLSWSTSLKKHHLVYARPRASTMLYIGSDNGTLEYGPAEHGLIPVIHELLTGFGSTTIIEGSYTSHAIQAFGANRWVDLESRIDPLRRRSPLLLQLLTYASPKPERKPGAGRKETETMRAEDSAAAYLLGEIADASTYRRTEGLSFWGGFYLHRIQRFRRLPLDTLVSRLLEECVVPPHQAAGVTAVLRTIEADGATEAVSAAIRERPSLLAALAFDHVQTKRKAK